MRKNESGNVFVYVLIAVGLFAALMFTLSKGNEQGGGTAELADGESKVAAGEIIAFAASASNSLSQMQQTGATLDMVDFILPSDANFNDAPTIYKLFHPDGGGLGYKALPAKAIFDDGAGLAAGYYIGRFNNVEWTPTATHDVIFTAYEIKQNVCQELNVKMNGDATIPTVVGDSLTNLFVDDSLHPGTNSNFMVANCAACEEKSALCVTDGAGKYVFYSLLEVE